MAHEALKFNLKLDEESRWQPIFANQDYGTFYIVYIKLNGYSNFEDNENQLLLECDFKIQNYIGAITMGIPEQPSITYIPEDYKLKGDLRVDVTLNLKVEPFLKLDNDELLNCKIPVTQPLEKGMILMTDYKKMLPANNLYKKNEDGEFENYPLYDDQNPQDAVFLDPYSFERSGDWLTELATRKYKSGEQFNSVNLMGCRPGSCRPDRCLII